MPIAFGTPGSLPSSENTGKKGEHLYTARDGQQISSDLHKQEGWSLIPILVKLSEGNVGMVHG